MDSIAFLISTTHTTDDVKNTIPVESRREIYVSVHSIRESTFMKAATVGIQPECQFNTFYLDYEGEPMIEYQGVRYRIFRTYRKPEDEIVEIYAERMEGQGENIGERTGQSGHGGTKEL